MLLWHCLVCHFNPLPPHGGRPMFFFVPETKVVFQSTPSTRRETRAINNIPKGDIKFQSTPSTRRETRRGFRSYIPSIYFNPLPPHGGRPGLFSMFHTSIQYFNPLPPHGGRRLRVVTSPPQKYFNPLPPHGGRRTGHFETINRFDISIHSLHTEGDTATCKPF